uniref:Uncharacterized protein n=1 Tax=Timema douglasi TaxID=61478 RepID=A0A7R8VJF6_TIMDO|nr:unnamed protein product [Timema douglasi]
MCDGCRPHVLSVEGDVDEIPHVTKTCPARLTGFEPIKHRTFEPSFVWIPSSCSPRSLPLPNAERVTKPPLTPDMLSNIPDLQEEVTSAPAATVAPDSPDLLELFTEDGICLAENDWSMDYWGDRDVSPPVQAPTPVIDDSFGYQASVTSEEGYNDLLDRLICPPETQDGVQAILGSQAVITAIILEGFSDVLA